VTWKKYMDPLLPWFLSHSLLHYFISLSLLLFRHCISLSLNLHVGSLSIFNFIFILFSTFLKHFIVYKMLNMSYNITPLSVILGQWQLVNYWIVVSNYLYVFSLQTLVKVASENSRNTSIGTWVFNQIY
jgi:hypothetical protein